MYQQKHCHKSNELKNNGPYCNIGISFRCFIHPLHAYCIQYNCQADNQKQFLFLTKPWYIKYHKKQCHVGYQAHAQVNKKQFMNRPTQFLPIITYLRTCPNPIGRYAHLCKHGKIRHHRCRKGNFANSSRL